jgi:hypothetical protein
MSHLRVGRRTPLGTCATCIKELTRSVADCYASQPGQTSIFSILFRQSNRFIGRALPGIRTSAVVSTGTNPTASTRTCQNCVVHAEGRPRRLAWAAFLAKAKAQWHNTG